MIYGVVVKTSFLLLSTSKSWTSFLTTMADDQMPFRFTGQPLDAQLVANVASLLDAEGIPYVIWGNWLLKLFGVPTIVDVRPQAALSLYPGRPD